jgi:hypothetical protein
LRHILKEAVFAPQMSAAISGAKFHEFRAQWEPSSCMWTKGQTAAQAEEISDGQT